MGNVPWQEQLPKCGTEPGEQEWEMAGGAASPNTCRCSWQGGDQEFPQGSTEPPVSPSLNQFRASPRVTRQQEEMGTAPYTLGTPWAHLDTSQLHAGYTLDTPGIHPEPFTKHHTPVFPIDQFWFFQSIPFFPIDSGFSNQFCFFQEINSQPTQWGQKGLLRMMGIPEGLGFQGLAQG